MKFERGRQLCRLATVIAEADGFPQWMSRNRAVSTAYYALFHSLAEFCALQLVGAWRPYPAFRHIYRSLDHSSARNALRDFPVGSPPSVALELFVTFFLDLQDKRHRADYDPSYRISSAELRSLISDTARQIETLDGFGLEEGRLFAARLIGRPRR